MEQPDKSRVGSEVNKWSGILERMIAGSITPSDVVCVAEFVIEHFNDIAQEYSSINAGAITDGLEDWLNGTKKAHGWVEIEAEYVRPAKGE
jgi:hypothetical protein